MEESLFKKGDRVEIIKYGHLMWEHKNGKRIFKDLLPELVGQIGIVSKISVNQGIVEYSLDGILGKSSWYSQKQLKLIK